MMRPTRVLILLAKKPDPATEDQARAEEIPYPEYLALRDEAAATLWDFHDVERSSHPLVKLARSRGLRFGLALLGFLHRRDFDQIYCTGEDVGLPFAALMKVVRSHGRTTCVIHNAGHRKRLAMLRGLGPRVWHALICLCDSERRVLTREARIPAQLVTQLPQWIDTRFYTPERANVTDAGDYAFACGQQGRDYPLLEKAARGLEICFRVKASGWAPHAGFSTINTIATGANIEVVDGSLTYAQLRDAYAGARFVVAPIQPVSYGAGVTSICEAMAMGKPVVATASPGIVDYVRDGETGFLVPCGDEPALRAAMRRLLDDDALGREMGANGRRWVSGDFSTWRYAERVAGLLKR